MLRMRRSSAVLAMWVGFVLIAIGCAGAYEPEENSGRDTARQGAQTIPLATAVTDGVNYEGGDATDWKVFEMPAPGRVTVQLYLDNHPNIQASLGLFDQYGGEVETMNASGEQETILRANVNEAGLYYVRVQSTQGRSTYSVRVYQGDPTGPAEVSDPRPEFDRPL
jgi:hypothetical protein